MFRPEQSQIQGKVCLYKTPEALWDFARQESIQQKVGLIIHGRLNISFCVTADLSRIEICFYIPYFAFQKQIFISKTIRSTGYEIEVLGPLSLFQLIILFSEINKPIPWQVFKFLKVTFEKQQSFILSDFFLLCCQPDTGLSYTIWPSHKDNFSRYCNNQSSFKLCLYASIRDSKSVRSQEPASQHVQGHQPQ